MDYGKEMCLVRNKMKSIMIEFNQIVKDKTPNASRDPQMLNELFTISDGLAEKYNEFQLKYMKLQFLGDLREILGEETADRFLKIQKDGPRGEPDSNQSEGKGK